VNEANSDDTHRHHQAEAFRQRADAIKTRTRQIIDGRKLSLVKSVVIRFFEIGGTRQAMLVAFNMFIGFFPLVIIVMAVAARRHPAMTIGKRIVRLIGLHGQSADIVAGAFPAGEKVLISASLITVLSLALSGLDVAGGVSDAFCRAWHVPRRKGWTSPLRGIAWFGLVMAQFFLIAVVTRSRGRSAVVQHLVALPLLLLAVYWFWRTTPRLLLNKPLHGRDLRPVALVGVCGTAVLALFTQFVLPGWFNSYAKGFGGVGVALGVASFLYVVGIIWILIVVIGAVIWERTAPLGEVVAFTAEPAEDQPALGSSRP
jgi:uncharacterized BrkB/YihY/UPF0761 family membrane protein